MNKIIIIINIIITIINEVYQAYYFGIVIDGTSDISHKEQLVFVIKYIHKDKEVWSTKQRFLKLVNFMKKTGTEKIERGIY